MTTFFSNKFATLEIDAEKSLLYQIWHPATSEMKNVDYQEVQRNTVEAVKKYQIQKILGDTLNLSFVIDVKMQEWTKENVLEPLMSAKVQKIAYLISSYFLTELSVHQAVSEDNKFNSSSKYFDKREEAIAWLLQ